MFGDHNIHLNQNLQFDILGKESLIDALMLSSTNV